MRKINLISILFSRKLFHDYLRYISLLNCVLFNQVLKYNVKYIFIKNKCKFCGFVRKLMIFLLEKSRNKVNTKMVGQKYRIDYIN